MNYQRIEKGRPIRLCFLGCGKICKAHAKNIVKSDNDLNLSFASRDSEKAREFTSKFKGHRAFSSYDEAIANDDIDVVMITTPPDSHYELTLKALNAGKHVIVEKPPYFKSSDFDVLGSLADEKKLQLLVAENYFYKPLRIKIKELLESGIIGKAIFININATKKQKSKGDWRDDVKVSGHGALFEGGIHWVNFINNIGLNLQHSEGFVTDASDPLERSIQLSSNSEEGTIVNLFYSWEVDTIFKGLRLSKIFGSQGSITFETNGIFVFTRGKKIKFCMPDLSNITGSHLMLNDFMTALRSGDDAGFHWKMAKKDLEIIEAVYQSIKNKI